ncbi:poly(ADP-ribose) polymerase family member 14-related sequence 1 isoform X2 [Alosa sapidissima]|uniref:poly(ADP-ribose) polymerase family member 14-related sequence 1 isoform X2 n=1 Tax=Alosa sapidissima TaxID=34773 RepID=UPI001C09CDDA|nr:poly(ADP-ribose) polymerase family member 14-related sequence 1 isoform X2 [Alosa sapidissima]
MDDNFTFPVLVEGEWNPALPNLRNKLTIYFQSKKSNGGDCWVQHDVSDGQRAIVSFKSEQVRQSVLAKCPHKLKLGQNVLNLSVRLPSETTDVEKSCFLEVSEDTQHSHHKRKDDANTFTMLDPKRRRAIGEDKTLPAEEQKEDPEDSLAVAAVLGNTEELRHEFLEMLVENILKGHDPSSWSVEIVPEISSAVVMFDNAEDAQQFVKICPSNKMFSSKKLIIRLLEVPVKVRAEDLISDITSDHLQLYFQKDEDVKEDVEMLEEEQAAIVTFSEPRAVARVINRQHVISGHAFKVFPYYDSLGTAVYGKDRPTWKLPDAFTQDIGFALQKCLQENPECSALIDQEMAKLFCEVNLQLQPVSISPLPSLLQQKKQTAKLIRSWREQAASGFKELLSRFKCLQLHVPAVAWKESEVTILEAIQHKAVSLVLDQSQECMTVAGLPETIDGLGDLKTIVEKITKKAERELGSQAIEVPVASSVYQLLERGLQQKIASDFPELKFRYNKPTQNIELYGLQNEILSSKAYILEEVLTFSLNGKPVDLDDSIIQFLSEGDQEELNEQLFMSQGISAALEIKGNRVNLLANKEEAVRDAEGQLEKLLNHKCVEVEDLNVFRMTEWQQLVDSLQASSNQPKRRVSVHTAGVLVMVCGFVDTVDDVQKQLYDFVHDNSSITRTVTDRKLIIKFVREMKKDTLNKMIKEDIKIDFKEDSVSLSGPRVLVVECMQTIQDLISSVHHDVLRVAKPGAKKSFLDKELIYESMSITKWHCLVQLEDDMDTPQMDTSGPESKPAYHLQTPDGVEISVFKADMCSFRVETIVNAANETLQHEGGLAGALVQAAGPQLQEMCNQIISSRGQLATGDVVITAAGGRLRCEHIIHAVGPKFSGNNPQRAVGLLKRAIKGCLREAERFKFHSLAIPAISSGSFGFPLNLCAETIVGAIKEHCEDMYGDGLLKKIHLVNKDDQTVQAMETAVRKIFDRPVHRQTETRSQVRTDQNPGPSQRHGRAPTGSPTPSVQTKEGLSITLLKGNIQDTTTDVVVNTVGSGLRLDQGAVSNALFRAAGPELQNLVDQQAAPPANEGAIIVTEGCNLRSNMVFHTVAPQWDGGQGHAQKVLGDIVADCFAQAEQHRQSSLTFPAIGTGNLGFPRDEVAKLMLDAVLNFSQKRSSNNVQEVVFILHPSDTHTTQAFTDEFNQRFLNQAASSQTKGPFSKITSPSSGLYQTTVGEVVLQITTGDITKEDSDVIVNSSNDTFTLNSGVSKAILDAAGPMVMLECQQQGAQPGRAMIMTQPGNLKCKKILHLHGQTKPQMIQKIVGDAISLSIQNNMRSISFPALGTGQGNVAPGLVADAMLDAVVDVVGQKPVSSLQLIRIVIFQAPMLAEFYKSMQKKEGSNKPVKEGMGAKIMSSLKSFFTGPWVKDAKPQKSEDIAFEGKVLVPAFFHICGESQANVDEVKKWIEELISQDLFIDTITDDMLLNLPSSDIKIIQDLQEKYDVKMTLTTDSQGTMGADDATLTIEGLSRDVAASSREVQKILSKSRERESLERQMELTSNLVEWQYKVQGQYQAFDPENNLRLEQAKEKRQRQVEVTIQGQKYTATLPDGPAVDIHRNQVKLKRVDKLQGDTSVPDNWDDMTPNSQCQVFLLQNNSQEYLHVQKLFLKSCRNAILKIERVQNPYLWRNYEIKKQAMEVKNGHKNNERQLFHGTSQPTINHINHNGFNRSYAGKNAAAYGNGTYFAVHAKYSAANTYSVPDAQGQKYMYLCRVLTGDFTAGRGGMIVPPAKNTTTADLYDTVTDNPIAPSMFVVFNDIQAYPEYLITFQ